RRRQHPRRRRNCGRVDACGSPDCRDRQRARLHQRFAVLDSRRAGHADSGDGGRRHPAAPTPSGRITGMAVLAPEVRRTAPRWLIRHETLLAVILVVALMILGLLNGRFLTIDNLLNPGRLITAVGLIALP